MSILIKSPQNYVGSCAIFYHCAMLRFAHSLSQLKWFQIQIKSNLAQPGLDFKRMERDERAAAGEEINETK